MTNPVESINLQYFSGNFSAEAELLSDIRSLLMGQSPRLDSLSEISFAFDPGISTTFITLFQRGNIPVRWGCRRATLKQSILRNTEMIRNHRRFRQFDPSDEATCRILIETVTKQWPIQISKVSENRFDDHRFEPGITGFMFRYNEQTNHYMPTDAVTNSHMTLRHALNLMSKKCGIAKQTNSISLRVGMMKSMPITYWMTNSVAFVSGKTKGAVALPLYRGYPMPPHDTGNETLLGLFDGGIDWVMRNMKKDGSFLYYYEGIQDTVVDHVHPNMVDPTYYNILRHSGGTIALLRAYELHGEKRFLDKAKLSLEYLLANCRERTINGEQALFVFFNQKSKLGGTGIGLAALMHYVRLSGDHGYRDAIIGMVRHLLSQIDETGEMIGYYIHPQFNNGNPILNPDDPTKRALFSFYYPGEALQGLALFCLHFPEPDPELVEEIKAKAKKALDFLVHERPKKYPELFAPLPSDGWLMQAIEEWFHIPDLRDDCYLEFVFKDADAMLRHMYTEENSPFIDYPGGYFYEYGDHVYTDGARCEGLVAAYFLARRVGDNERSERYRSGCYLAAKNLNYTVNTPQSVYAHRYPEKSAGSFRFKLTRQWVRIDSVQHTACFFARLAGDLG